MLTVIQASVALDAHCGEGAFLNYFDKESVSDITLDGRLLLDLNLDACRAASVYSSRGFGCSTSPGLRYDRSPGLKKFVLNSKVEAKAVSLLGNSNAVEPEGKEKKFNAIGEALKKRYIEPTVHELSKDNYFKRQTIHINTQSKLEIALRKKIALGVKNLNDEKYADAHIDALRELKQLEEDIARREEQRNIMALKERERVTAERSD